VVIRVSDRLLFASASAELNPEALPLLRVVAGVLRGISSDVRVEGHTDDVPVLSERYATNWELSSARATTVLRFLVEEGDVEARRMVAAGYAEFRPLASNTTPEGRALNRRADIVLTAPPPRTATPAAARPVIDPAVTPVPASSEGAHP
jgi:chemotaxis protein MotB